MMHQVPCRAIEFWPSCCPCALDEADVSRWKRVICNGLHRQTDRRQTTEVVIAAEALNRMLDLGRLEYVRVA